MSSWNGAGMAEKQFLFTSSPDNTADLDVGLSSLFPIGDSLYDSSLQEKTLDSTLDSHKLSATNSTSSSNGTIPTSSSEESTFDTMSSDYLSSTRIPQSQHDWILNPTTGEVVDSFLSDQTTKRTRMENDDSDINACWKSPLCPNRKADGSHPDACQGECVDFLFAHPSTLPDDKKMLSDLMARSQPKISLETPYDERRTLKRTEMESPHENTGRSTSLEEDDENTSPISAQSRSSTLSTQRKSSSDLTQLDKSLPSQAKAKGRVPHNQVEKKYRENVNAQFEALRRALPMSKNHLINFSGTDGLGFDIEDLAATAAARQPSKAVVLSSATAYIKMLERENRKLKEDMDSMKGHNRTLQNLVSAKCDDCSLMDYVRRWKIQGPVV